MPSGLETGCAQCNDIRSTGRGLDRRSSSIGGRDGAAVAAASMQGAVSVQPAGPREAIR